MNISEEKIDDVTTVLKVEIVKEDYFDIVQKELKEYHKTARIPGFRPGKIPFSVIKSKYEKHTKYEKIIKMVIESVFGYIDQNKLEIMGTPLPDKEKIKSINWDTQTEFEFFYNVAIKPQFELEPLENFEVKYYNIVPEDYFVDKYVTDFQKKHSTLSDCEISGEDDLLKVEIAELDETGNLKEQGIVKDAVILIDYIHNSEKKQKFVGLKENDFSDVFLAETFDDHAEIAALLEIGKSEIAGLKNKFRITVKEIKHPVPAPLDTELFSKAYNSEKITTTEQFRERIKKEISDSMIPQSDNKFFENLSEILVNNTEINFPHALLRRMINETDDNLKSELSDKEYKYYCEDLKWRMIQNKLVKNYNIIVGDDEIKEYIKNYYLRLAYQRNYQPTDEEIEKSAAKYLENNKPEDIEKIKEEIVYFKIRELCKSKVKLIHEDISYEKFMLLPRTEHDFEQINEQEHELHNH